MEIKSAFTNKEYVYFIHSNGSVVLKNIKLDKYYEYPSVTPFKGDIGPMEKYLQENKDTIEEILEDSPGNVISYFEDEPTLKISDVPKFTIISVSAKDSADKTLIKKSFNKMSSFRTEKNGVLYEIEMDQILNNSVGLSTIYNAYIKEDNRDRILVFVHDDVWIEDLFLFEKLAEAHKIYDIVGVAGCKDPDIKSPAYWHLMAPRQNLRGFCYHQTNDGNSVMTSFGKTRTDVDLIDGVFMSLKVSSLLDADVRFNEKFDFHFYDLAFSLNARKAGLKLGVWPIFITHASPGGGNDRWKQLEPVFLAEYSGDV